MDRTPTGPEGRTQAPGPTAALLVIGDEILSGRTQDVNVAHLAGRLGERGIRLVEVRIVSDVSEAIVDALDALRARATYVFTSGGIGPTHDDITADAVASAFGLPIDVREDARAILEAHYARTNQPVTEARLRMARVPDGARLIANPISGAPGFWIENVLVMAGVPRIFAAMVETVLPALETGAIMLSVSEDVFLPEGDIAGPLGELNARHALVSVGSYPFEREGRLGAAIVLRSEDPVALEAAHADVRRVFGG